jgi:hypothetical protein
MGGRGQDSASLPRYMSPPHGVLLANNKVPVPLHPCVTTQVGEESTSADTIVNSVVGSERRQMWSVQRHRVKADRCVEIGIMVFAIPGMFLVSIGSIQLPMVFTGVLAGRRGSLACSLVAFGCWMVQVC